MCSVCVYGGGSRKGQIQVVQKGVEIVIGESKNASLSSIVFQLTTVVSVPHPFLRLGVVLGL